MTTYTSEPGTRLGGRYRLEDRIAAGSGWAAWKAIDETLARAVTVFTFEQGYPRIADVVTAARTASRLTDPRLAQVFDVEDAWDRAYIVMEWAAGETLADLLSAGPLETSRGARMIAEAAAALSAAHAAGVAHLCLSPGSVRLSQTGEVKVVGLGIDAALSGATSEDPVLADTRGLGRLLYAALTGCWPGPDYPALPPAPVADGQPRAPRQVVAAVPQPLSELACRAMQLESRDGSPGIMTPGELARSLFAALPPAPIPSAPPPPARRDPRSERQRDPLDDPYWPGRGYTGSAGRREYDGYESTGWQQEDAGRADTNWPRRQDPEHDGGAGHARPPERRGHRAENARQPGLALLGKRTLPFIGETRLPVGIVAVAGALVLVAAVATIALWPSGGKSLTSRHRPGPTASAVSISTLRPERATGFDPLTSVTRDSGNENSQYARYAIDASPRSAWSSQWYRTAAFGGLKAGSGLIVEMSQPVTYRSVSVTFGTAAPGGDVELLVGTSAARSSANLSSMTKVASASDVSGTRTFRISSSAKGRFLVIWFTKLPPKPGGGHLFMAQVFNVAVRGIR